MRHPDGFFFFFSGNYKMNFYVNFDTLLEKSLCIRIYKKFIFYKIIKKKNTHSSKYGGKGLWQEDEVQPSL